MIRSLLAILLFITGLSAEARAGNFPFEITHPHTGDTAVIRHTKAYPGLEYYLEPVGIGGDWPWTAALTTAPAGMTVASEIDSLTGMPKIVIRWPNPTTVGSPHTVTLQMWDTDKDGTGSADVQETDTVSWTVTVTTSGFLFLDAVNGNNSWNGLSPVFTSGSNGPKQTLNGAFGSTQGDSTFSGYFMYVRAGTYTIQTLPNQGGTTPRPGLQIFWSTIKPTVWLAYPGDAQPVIDFGFNDVSGQARYFLWDDPYIDGIRFTNSSNHFLRGLSPYARILRSKFDNLGPGFTGFNSAAIMSVATTCVPAVYPNIAGCHEYGAITSSEFVDIDNACAIKIYSLKFFAFQVNWVHNTFSSGSDTEGIALKGGVMYHMDITGNRLNDNEDRAMNGNWQDIHRADIRFTRSYDNPLRAWDLNQGGESTEVFFDRNTIIGSEVIMRNVQELDDGPFTWSNNVIVNEFSGTPTGSHITHVSVTQPSQVVISADPNGNLVGNAAAGIVDATGQLQGTYLDTYFGLKGFQVSSGGPPPSPPAPPRRPRIGVPQSLPGGFR